MNAANMVAADLLPGDMIVYPQSKSAFMILQVVPTSDTTLSITWLTLFEKPTSAGNRLFVSSYDRHQVFAYEKEQAYVVRPA